MSPSELWASTDAVGQAVALVLLLMSLASWTVIAHKAWSLRGARARIVRATAAFWQAPNWASGLQSLSALDPQGWVHPLAVAAQTPAAGTLAAEGHRAAQLTRSLRNALQAASARLHFGQTLLATVAATAPFVGLLGTVWGIYHALTGIAGAGQISIERVAGPVGEALVMTAAGLAVAIPAVLAYNAFARAIARIEAELEGFAHDLRELAP